MQERRKEPATNYSHMHQTPLPGFHTEGGHPGIPPPEKIDGNIISIMNLDGMTLKAGKGMRGGGAGWGHRVGAGPTCSPAKNPV